MMKYLEKRMFLFFLILILLLPSSTFAFSDVFDEYGFKVSQNQGDGSFGLIFSFGKTKGKPRGRFLWLKQELEGTKGTVLAVCKTKSQGDGSSGFFLLSSFVVYLMALISCLRLGFKKA